jgi:hypothetical protein
MHWVRTFTVGGCLASFGLVLAPHARADRFLLASGGVVEGTLLNRDQLPRATYEVRTAAGAKVVLSAATVVEVERQKASQEQYARVAPSFADTAAGQWQAAEWCRQQQLKDERAAHLRRVVELSPDHLEARHALGYVQLEGKWITQADKMDERGYVLHEGKFRTPQDIELIQARAKAKQAAKEWLAKLKAWRTQLNDPKLAAGAYQRIAAVRDPAAVAPLVELHQADRQRATKMLYVEVLEAIHSPEAIEALVYISLNDADVEIFHACAEALERLDPPNLIEPYLKALRDDNNVRINRAGKMLGQIGDKSAIGPLIDVLLTRHRIVTGGDSGVGTPVSAGFDNAGGNSFKASSAPVETVAVAQNVPILDALTRLSGESFGFDLPAWKRWHAAQKARSDGAKLK